MKQRLLVLLAFGAMLCAAPAPGLDYTVTRTVALSNATEAVTIQQPASGARTVNFSGAYVYCSVDCEVRLERDGTAATATVATPAPIRATVAASKATAFVASDVGTGTVLGDYTISGGGSMGLDLSSAGLYGDGTGKNLTVRIPTAITGVVKIVVQFSEAR